MYIKGAKPNTVVSTGFAVIRPRDIDSRYTHYVLTSDPFIEHLTANATGSAYPAVSPEIIAKTLIPLPPKDEQKRIGEILGALDEKIELNHRMNRTLEAIARAIFKSWFVDFEPVRAKMEGRWRRGESLPGFPAHLYDLFPDRLVDSELGGIPEGWAVGTLGSVAENPRRSIQPDQIEAHTPYIGLEHMPRRCIALSDWGHTEEIESSKFGFRRGEILFGKLRPYFHKVGIAPIDGVCSTDILVIIPREPEWTYFVLGHVSAVDFIDYTNASSTGTKMPRTSWQDMARYKVALPPKRLALTFTDQIHPLIERIIANIYESHTLADLRNVLLPKLISRELQVKDTEQVIGRALR